MTLNGSGPTLLKILRGNSCGQASSPVERSTADPNSAPGYRPDSGYVRRPRWRNALRMDGIPSAVSHQEKHFTVPIRFNPNEATLDFLPSSGAKILADSDCVVAAPWTIWAEVGGPQVAITCSEAVKEKVLGNPHLEAFSNVNGSAPGMFDADAVEGPGIEVLRNVPAEKETRLAKEHEAAQLAPSKWPDFEQSRKHISRKFATGSISAAEFASIGP